METKKMYEENAYQMDFEARVFDCILEEETADKKYYRIVLDKTCFFPEGGGQKGDTGLLNQVIVFDTQINEGVIIHFTKEEIKIGSPVYGQVNWKQRFSYMQHHTGEHILSGLIYMSYGYQNVGFHLSENSVTIDVEHELNQTQLEELETAANRIIWENLPIEVSYPSEIELDELSYRSKKEISGQMRIVSIPNIDCCACCAPHVKRTGELGSISISRWDKYKGGVRLELKCGARAVESHRKLLNTNLKLSALLSAKMENLEEAVERLLEEKRSEKEKLLELQIDNAKRRAENVIVKEGKIIQFEEEMDSLIQKTYMNLLMGKEATIVSVFVGSDENGYRYQIASNKMDLKKLQEELKEEFAVKGGGNKNLIQGSIVGTKLKLEKFIQNI